MEHAVDNPHVSETPTESLPKKPYQEITPIASNERIQSMDVARGFALIGIFFMNIEWFNRSFAEFGTGIPAGVHGIDWIASYFVNFFVAGKFWTIFSLLFGMGFAVMLTRSEETGRAFLLPYIRRIIALAIFGTLHNVLVWPGDILLSYAFTAAGLLIILFGKWQWIVLSMVVLGGISAIPAMNSMVTVVSVIGLMGFIALFMRNEKMVSFAGKQMPLFSMIFLVIGVVTSIVAAASWFVPPMKDAASGITAGAVATLVLAWASARFHQPVSARAWRAGVWLYCLPFVIGLPFAVVDYNKPLHDVMKSAPALKLAEEKAAIKLAEEKAEKAEKATPASAKPAAKDAKPEAKKDPKKPDAVKKTEAEKKLDDDADRVNRVKERQKEKLEDINVLTKGSYTDVVKLRFKKFVDDGFNHAGMAFAAIGMFLLGLWFVRSGVMANARDHLPLFRKIAIIGLPLGWGLSVLASSFAVSHVPGVSGDGWMLVQMLLNLGNLPTCLAYVSIIVLMTHSNSIFSNIKVLAPFGRMALTNYLMQSVIQASFFYGWGLGNFGMGRAEQLGFAVGVICLQVLFSHIWLSMFRYGPMEWLWRAITYWKIPALRIERVGLTPQMG